MGRVVRWLSAVGLAGLWAALASPAVWAECLVPKAWSQPVDISSNAVAQAIYRVSVWVLPIIGAVVLILGFFHLMIAVYQGLRGESVAAGQILRVGGVPSVFARVIEILVGMLLIAVPLSGAWVDVVNAGYNLTLTVIHQAVGAMGGSQC